MKTEYRNNNLACLPCDGLVFIPLVCCAVGKPFESERVKE